MSSSRIATHFLAIAVIAICAMTAVYIWNVITPSSWRFLSEEALDWLEVVIIPWLVLYRTITDRIR